MSLQATAPAYEPTLDLLEEDGEPLETQWHQLEMTLLIEVTRQAMEERGHRLRARLAEVPREGP